MTPFAGHDHCRVLQHPRVSVETDQDSVRLDFWKDVSAVTTSADCAVNDCQPRTQVESLQRFPQQNGDVNRSQGRCISEWKWPENSGGYEAGLLGKATSTQPHSAKWAGLYVDSANCEKSRVCEVKSWCAEQDLRVSFRSTTGGVIRVRLVHPCAKFFPAVFRLQRLRTRMQAAHTDQAPAETLACFG